MLMCSVSLECTKQTAANFSRGTGDGGREFKSSRLSQPAGFKSSRLILLHNTKIATYTKFGKSLKWKLPRGLRKVFEVHLATNSILSHLRVARCAGVQVVMVLQVDH